jgi:hypothetical protein
MVAFRLTKSLVDKIMGGDAIATKNLVDPRKMGRTAGRAANFCGEKRRPPLSAASLKWLSG